MSIKFKTELYGVEFEKGDIVAIKVNLEYVTYGNNKILCLTKDYTGRVTGVNINNNDIVLDCSKQYELNVKRFNCDDIVEICNITKDKELQEDNKTVEEYYKITYRDITYKYQHPFYINIKNKEKLKPNLEELVNKGRYDIKVYHVTESIELIDSIN